jgi:hypothetical protein
MSSVILAIVALLAAGFAFGALRRRPARPRSGISMGLAIMAVGVPPATLVLAKLLGSAVLGWMFGLTLMLAFALAPCAAVFWIGTKFGARIIGRRELPPAVPSPFAVDVERDGVHASDDAPPKRIAVEPGTSLRTLLGLALADAYLPTISGGRATWVAESSAGPAIAVLAQQWAEPVFLVAPEAAAAAHFGRQAARLNFSYRRQDDPAAVLAELSQGAV